MTQQIFSHEFDNGMVLVAESMPYLESAAFALVVPSGCSRDPANRLGLSNFTCEMLQRGCGARDSHQFIEDLELLGVDSSASVSTVHCSFGGAMPAESLSEALAIHADLVRRPHLPEDQLDDARLVCLQEVRAIEDDLPQKLMLELSALRYPDPWGRSSPGNIDSVESIQLDEIVRFFKNYYRPNGTILSVAGKIDWPQLRDRVAELFSDWQRREVAPIEESNPDGTYLHVPHESSQTQIGVAYPSVPYSNDDFFQARGAVGVLSDGMSSRLFTEVREKRGLCYAVSASCHSLRDRGSVFCYAGTTTDRAQETLDVLLSELRRLAEGVEADELDRLKNKIKSALIMQQESSTARSGAIAVDWYYLNRVRTRDELGAIIDGLTCDSINHYLAAHPPADFVVATLGENPLEASCGVS